MSDGLKRWQIWQIYFFANQLFSSQCQNAGIVAGGTSLEVTIYN
jgi:hypothetical protein